MFSGTHIGQTPSSHNRLSMPQASAQSVEEAPNSAKVASEYRKQQETSSIEEYLKRGVESIEQQKYLKAELNKIKIQTQNAAKSRETAIIGPSTKLISATQMLPSVSTHQSNLSKASKPPQAVPNPKGKLSNMTAHTA